MKKILFALTVVLIVLSYSVSAQTTFDDGKLYYSVISRSKKTVKVINNGNYKTMTSVNIPNSVTTKGVSYTVTKIGEGAFQECNLTSIVISNSITEIGEKAFFKCRNLASVNIPQSVQNIGRQAFQTCHSLVSVDIPAGVEAIADYAFHNCNNLKSINVSSNNQYYCSENGVLFNKQMTELICYPRNKVGTSYEIPNTVAYIDDYAFYYSNNLTSVVFPKSLCVIGKNAFYETKLTSVSLQSCPILKGQAFTSCNFINCVMPAKTYYAVGDDFDGSGLKVYLNKADGTNEEITEYSLSGFDSKSAGDKTIKITYGKYTQEFTVHVRKAGTFADLSVYFPPVKCQWYSYDDNGNEIEDGYDSERGTCMAMAMGYYYRTYLRAKALNLTKEDLEKQENQFSPKYLFMATVNEGWDEGLNRWNTLYAMKNKGVATMKTVPYRDFNSLTPTQAWNEEAAQYKITSWDSLTTSSEFTKENLKQYLLESKAIVFSANHHKDKQKSNFHQMKGDGVLCDENLSSPGQHVMVIVGFDDSKGENGAFKVINSYTEDWADYGYIWVDQDFMVKNYANNHKGFANWAYVLYADDRIIDNIEIENTKTGYYLGEDFDKSSLTVTAKYTNGSTEEITDYELSGFDSESAGEKTITVAYKGKTASFKVNVENNTHKITYFVDNKEYKTDDVFVGSEIVLIDKPKKTGYKFSGWHCEYSTMPDKDITVEGSFSPIEYQIIYNLVGGELSMGNPSTYTIVDDDFILNNPTKEGYVFIGWTSDDNTEPSVSVAINHGSVGAKSFTANWTKEETSQSNDYCTITFDLNGGNGSIEPFKESKGDIFPCPEAWEYFGTVSKKGYFLDGWSLTKNGDKTNGFIVEKNTVLFAVWLPITSLRIVPPEKTEYNVGEDFSISGIRVYAVCSDGSEIEVYDRSTELEFFYFDIDKSDFDTQTPGIKTIKVDYDGIEATFDVTIRSEGSYVDLSNYFPPVKCQWYSYDANNVEYTQKDGGDYYDGQRGTCAAMAMGYYYRTFLRAKALNLSKDDLQDTKNQFSPKYLYMVTENHNPYYHGGLEIGNTLTALMNYGIATMKTVPYIDFSEIAGTDAEWDEEAAKYKINSYHMFSDGEFTKANIKKHLLDSEPIAVSINHNSDKGLSNFRQTNGDDVLYSEDLSSKDRHVMVIVGFDDSKGKNGAFKLINSYPDTWADNGFIWIDQNFMVEEFNGSGFANWACIMYADDKEVKSLEVETTKTTYFVGDDFDESTITVVAKYTDGSEKNVTEYCKFSGFDSETAGEKTITVLYKNKTATIYVSVENKTHKITYLVDSEEYEVVNNVVVGSDIVFIDEPVKEGYTFSGWSCSYTTMPDKDVTIKGKFTINKHNITYYVNDVVYRVKENVRFGTEISTVSYSARGYKFNGWQNVPATMPDEDIEIYGTATATEYSITYRLYDGVNAADNPSTYTVEDEVHLSEPSKTGYEFGGWSNDGVIEKGTTGDKTFYASWTPKEYQIHYNLDGGVNSSDNPSIYTIEDGITLSAPTKEGFEFVGWSNNGKIEEGSTDDKTFTATWKKIEVESIELTTEPTKLEYFVGEDFTPEGGVITVNYNNGDTKNVDLTNEIISDFDRNKVGKQTLTVTYKGKATTFEATVNAIEVKSIELTTKPKKLEYFVGEEFSPDGGVITVNYNNGETKDVDITKEMVADFKSTDAGTQTLTVTYLGKTATFEVEVKAIEVESIELTTKPEKIDYVEGEDFMENGGVITVKYNNGTSDIVVLTKEMVSGFDCDKVGKQTLTVKYCEKTTKFDVTVNRKNNPETGIEDVDTKPFAFNLFPNPTTDFVKIEGNNFKEKRYSIFTSNGRIVKNGLMVDDFVEIDVSDLSSGLYIIRIDNQSAKFIKQ